MNLIVCIDDNFGMLFNGRRVSRDRAVTEKIANLTEGKRLWMDAYSLELFPAADSAYVSSDFMDLCANEDWCFAENQDVSAFLDKVDSVVVFKWNRRYPSDLKFPWELFATRWYLLSTEEFSGFSHERITCEVYKL